VTLTEGRYRWNGGELRPAEGATLALLVADSFLIRDGAVVAPELHRARFLRDADTQGIVHSPTAFVDAAFAALPASGLWFPRFDLTERGELEVWVRPAPALSDTVTLWTSPDDPRTQPGIKGPDIPALAELRERAQEAGADEAVMLDSDGCVADGATTCFVWWRDDVFYTPPITAAGPPNAANRVSSVTVDVVRQMASETGVEVRHEEFAPADVVGQDLWALNALHGIRGVSVWNDGPTLSSDTDRLREWQTKYWSRATNVSEGT
jgi:branched-subunit amino acid aminotransferase/4-amino-4-deoxychorismate lyase